MNIAFIERTNGKKINGSYLRCRFEGISIKDMQNTFSDPDDNSYFDPKSGYEGFSWTFRDNAGNEFIVYDRWNCLRLGATPNVSDENVKLIADFLLHAVTINKKR